MKILIGVDDSPHSQAALEYVKTMQWPAGTKFLVLSAARPQVAYTMMDAGGMSWLRTAEEETFRDAEELTSRAERELQKYGMASEARVMQGDPREVLVETAHGWGADLLVVGSHGRSGLGNLVMGSVAHHVVSHAPCSVLVVRLRKK